MLTPPLLLLCLLSSLFLLLLLRLPVRRQRSLVSARASHVVGAACFSLSLDGIVDFLLVCVLKRGWKISNLQRKENTRYVSGRCLLALLPLLLRAYSPLSLLLVIAAGVGARVGSCAR